MGIKKYIKRLFRYVLYEHKQPIVYAKIVQQADSMIFKDKVVLVTGGGRGLGFYISKRLINNGAIVIITGRNEQQLINSQKKLGENCKYRVMDVTNLNECKKILKEIFNEYGKLDVLINNAGISLHEKNILEVTEDNYTRQFDTNLKAPYFLCQYYIEQYREYKQKEGNIIFISSERGGQCDDIPYGLTKISINSLTQALARRFYIEGIRINAVAPGVTASDMTNIKKDSDLSNDRTAGRYFVPEEVAEVVNFLISDYSKCISGEIINCDGGDYSNSYYHLIK